MKKFLICWLLKCGKVAGAKEVEENIVSIRSRECAENETMNVDEFVARIKDEVENKNK